MLIGLLIVLADLAAIGGLIIAIVRTVLRLRPSRLAWPGAAGLGRWMGLIMLVAALGLLVLGNARFLISAYDDGRPSRAQVSGTWTDGDGATLRMFPDGSFTAAGLPPDTDSSTGKAVTVRALPADEHGTWQMTRGDGTWYALCSLTSGPQFQLYIVPPSSPGDPLSANFTYVQGQFDLPTTDGFDKQPRDVTVGIPGEDG